MSKHACFDKDGTLTDVHVYWSHACELRAAALARAFGAEPAASLAWMGVKDGRIQPGGPVGFKPRASVVAAVAAKLGRPDAEVAAVFAEVDRDMQARNDFKVHALPGARETLARLKSAGWKVSVYTSDRRENARRAFAAAGLADFIDAVVGGDDVKKPKPHPEGLETACRLVGAAPAETVYVGDTLEDLAMARAVGARPIGVGTGVTPLEALAGDCPGSIATLEALSL